MSGITSRFVVKQCNTEEAEGDQRRFLIFVSPQVADYDSDKPESEGDPVADVLFEVADAAIPKQIEFTKWDEAKCGPYVEVGIWLIVPDRIAPGTVLDMTLSEVAFR